MSWKKNVAIFATLGLTAGAMLAGCGASDKAAEVITEQAIKAEGGNADVSIDSDGGTVRIAGQTEDGTFEVSGQGNQMSSTFTGEGGTTTVNVGDQVMVPPSFPGDFPIYNGFRPNSAVDAEEEKTITVIGQVSDALGVVSDWYKTEMPRNGWTEESSMDMGGQMSTMVYKKDNRTASIMAQAGPDGSMLTLSVVAE